MSSENQQHPDRFNIFINAQRETWNEDVIDYSQVINLAFPPPHKPTEMFTVQYSHGPHQNPQGTLAEGQKVQVKSGMIFNVGRTDKS